MRPHRSALFRAGLALLAAACLALVAAVAGAPALRHVVA
jgi:hypothetical protein